MFEFAVMPCKFTKNTNNYPVTRASSGERISAESLMQHAEHYYRLAAVNGAVVAERSGEDSEKDRQNGRLATTCQSSGQLCNRRRSA